MIDLILNDTPGEESLFWDREGDRGLKPLVWMPSDAFAALCIAVKRAANEREKVNGYHAKLEES